MLVLAACGLLPAAPPEWVVNRLPLESCGEEEVGVGGDDFNRSGRSCLLAAFERGEGAELISTMTSVEGDPITRIVRVHENGTVEVFVDATRDRFGSGDWERLRCDRLVPVAEFNRQGSSVPEAFVFVEDGCETLAVP